MSQAAPRKPSGDNKRILVIEDENEILDLAEFFLPLRGFEVVRCTEGQKALELMQQQEFCAVISDIKIGGKMSGIEVYNALLKQNIVIHPYVFITAYALDSNEFSKLDPNKPRPRVFFKPFSFNDIADYLMLELPRK